MLIPNVNSRPAPRSAQLTALMRKPDLSFGSKVAKVQQIQQHPIKTVNRCVEIWEGMLTPNVAV